MNSSTETNIKARRYGVVENTPKGDAIRVSASCFLEYISPPLHPSLNVEKIIGSFRSGAKRSRKVITGRNRWRGFAQDPAQLGDREQSCFRPLEDVLKAITKATGMHSSVQLRTNPQGGVLSPYRDANSLPDAYLVLDNPSGRPGWMDIAVSGEYRNNSTVSDNRFNTEKLLWSMSNILCRDPRRRFTYGFTIGNTDMRLWYCDRSRIIVSEPFNFITEHKLVVRFFASFLYARPDQIGWDLTMTPLHDNLKDLQYDIKVQTHDGEEVIYRTVTLLSDSGAQSLHGRGTRVWKVVRVKDGEAVGDPVVLKDSWVDLDRPREGAILQEICGMAASEPLDKTLSDALLTVECYGDVVIDGDGDRCIDRTTRMNLSDLPTHGSDTDAAVIKLLLHCHHKVHHRVVFKEICQTIQQLASFHDKFRVLGQTSITLKALHGFGWVHRDISSGNILMDSLGRAKLVDLEYAKKLDDSDSVTETQVGTSKYMAVEVGDRGYRFRPPRDHISPILEDYTPRATDFDSVSEGDSTLDTPPPLRPILPVPIRGPVTPFRYNPIHDFESLWWLAIHLMLKIDALYINEQGPPPARSLDELREQRNWSLFLSYDQTERLIALSDSYKFQEMLCSLHPSVKPYGSALDTWRSRITSAHRQAQQTPIPDADTAMRGLYDAFSKDLFTMANALARKTVVTEESEKERLAQLAAAAEVQETSAKKRKLDTQIESHENDRHPGGIDVAIPPHKKARIVRPVRAILVEGPAARTRSRTKANAR